MRRILRTQQIYIDLPKPQTEPWMNVVVQYVEMTDDLLTVLNTVDRWNQITVRVADIAWFTYPIYDPANPPCGYISNAGIVQAMSASIIDLIIQHFGGVLDSASGYVVLE